MPLSRNLNGEADEVKANQELKVMNKEVKAEMGRKRKMQEAKPKTQKENCC